MRANQVAITQTVFRDLEKIQEVHDVARNNTWLLFIGITVTVASLFGVGLAIGRGTSAEVIPTHMPIGRSADSFVGGETRGSLNPTQLRNTLTFPTVLQQGAHGLTPDNPPQTHPSQDTTPPSALPSALQQIISTQGDYAVQVMTTSSREEAAQFVDKLKALGHPAGLAVSPRKTGLRTRGYGGPVWRVRIGFFVSKSQAEVYRAYIEEQTQRDAIVTKVTS